MDDFAGLSQGLIRGVGVTFCGAQSIIGIFSEDGEKACFDIRGDDSFPFDCDPAFEAIEKVLEFPVDGNISLKEVWQAYSGETAPKWDATFLEKEAYASFIGNANDAVFKRLVQFRPDIPKDIMEYLKGINWFDLPANIRDLVSKAREETGYSEKISSVYTCPVEERNDRKLSWILGLSLKEVASIPNGLSKQEFLTKVYQPVKDHLVVRLQDAWAALNALRKRIEEGRPVAAEEDVSGWSVKEWETAPERKLELVLSQLQKGLEARDAGKILLDGPSMGTS